MLTTPLSTLFLALVVAAPPQSPHSSAPAVKSDKPGQTQRTVQQLRAAVSKTLRREALARDPAERRQAIGDLIALAVEVRDHPKLANGAGNRSLDRIQGRLRRVAQKIKRNLARRDAQQGRRPANVQLPNQGDEVRAQFGGGGFQNGFNQPGGAAQRPADDGEKLLELIEQTIAPASWQVNGGNGVIIYFRSRKVLVVRQRGEIHRDLVDLIEDLNGN